MPTPLLEQLQTLQVQGLSVNQAAKRLGKTKGYLYKLLRREKARQAAVQARLHRQPDPELTKPTAVLRRDLPPDSIIAMERASGNIPPDMPMLLSNCQGCKRNMWTPDPKLYDMCEDCAIFMMEDLETRQKAALAVAGNMATNPFLTDEVWGRSNFVIGTPAKQR